jgi:two-component system, LytTR family, response regulator
LKQPRDFRFIGKPLPRTDVPSKVDGSAGFGIDVRVPNMLFAVIARCPFFGGRLHTFDATAAKIVPGVRAVFPVSPLPRRFNTAGGVAVGADSTWAAMRGRKALVLRWDKGPGSSETTETLRKLVVQQASGPPTFIAVDRGDALEVLAGPVKKVEGYYESPFQAHATMEPMNTTIHVGDNEIEVWSPTQFADEVQKEIVELSGFPLDKVIVHMTLSGGSFGRRYQWDYAAEAWQVAKDMKKPVQLLWTREDDMQHDFYRPYNYQHLTGGFDAQGNLVAWSTRVVTTPIAGSNLYTGFTESAETLKDPATIAALEWYGADTFHSVTIGCIFCPGTISMSIGALVVDDEPLARRTIARFLQRHTDVEVVGECGDGESAVRAIRERRPDLVFLDIQMPEMDGFQVLTEVGSNEMPVTIFVTAFNRYALRAFDANAIDYLLKPFGKERFERALARAKRRIAGELKHDEVQRIISSLERLATARTYCDRLAIPKNGRVLFVATKDIDWIEAEGNYVRLHVGSCEHEFRETLGALEEKLNPAEFLRIHRSTIVNIQRIKEIQAWFHGHHRVLLENGTELRMSRYQREVARKLGLA